jgi:hypothetical protein
VLATNPVHANFAEFVGAAMFLIHERLDELGFRQGRFSNERLEIFEAFRQLDALYRDYKRSLQPNRKSISSADGSGPKGLPLQ